MKGKLLLFLLFFVSNIVFSQSHFANEQEETIYNCIDLKYKNMGISLKETFAQLEDFWMGHNFLKDTTQTGYVEMYQAMFDSTSVQLLPDYSSIGLDLRKYKLFEGCLISLVNHLPPSSDTRKLYYEFTKLHYKTNSKPVKTYHNIIRIIEKGDFTNDLFRMFVQYQFYAMTMTIPITE